VYSHILFINVRSVIKLKNAIVWSYMTHRRNVKLHKLTKNTFLKRKIETSFGVSDIMTLLHYYLCQNDGFYSYIKQNWIESLPKASTN